MSFPDTFDFKDKVIFNRSYSGVLSKAKKGQKGIVTRINGRDCGKRGEGLDFYGVTLDDGGFLSRVPYWVIDPTT